MWSIIAFVLQLSTGPTVRSDRERRDASAFILSSSPAATQLLRVGGGQVRAT